MNDSSHTCMCVHIHIFTHTQTQPPPLRPKPTIAALIRGQRSLETPPTHSRQPLTSREKSKIHFLCGQSLALGGANKEAAEEFGKVLQFTPSHNLVWESFNDGLFQFDVHTNHCQDLFIYIYIGLILAPIPKEV